ncbi:MAG: hypothetical protein Q8P02_02420 [Candidatus Micrarchaeota archaeon]|nr:hypothetical protein [Candidatus Micrarchaeota archaeon]
MNPTERQIVAMRKDADRAVDNHFNNRYAVDDSGFARIPSVEREAVRFIVKRRLEQKPTRFYRGLNLFSRDEQATRMVATVIRHYPLYAERYRGEALARDLDLPQELPDLRKGDFSAKAVDLIQWYDGQVRDLNAHIAEKEQELEKTNDPDAVSRLHDEYTRHLHFVDEALSFLEKHRDFREHKNPWRIQLENEETFWGFGVYTGINSAFRLGRSPQYPPLKGSWFKHSPQGHALHDLQNLADFVGPWRSNPEALDALFTHRLLTLQQYRMGLKGFVNRLARHARSLRSGERARETQPLDPKALRKSRH